MTVLYLVRHSEGFKSIQGDMNTKDSVQLINEKSPLSVRGEEIALNKSMNNEFKKIDVVYSSSYVRAMGTAKYFANNNNLKVNIDDRLGERIQGISSWDELPSDFNKLQLDDELYKIEFGENQLEVRKRMEEAIFELLSLYKDKRILVVSHSTAITFFLKRWCDICYDMPFIYNNKEIFSGDWDYCDSFKLSFDEFNLINIEYI